MLGLVCECLTTTQLALLGVTALLLLIGYLKIKKAQSYWKNRGVKYVEPRFLSGSFELWRTKSLPELVLDVYQKYPEERYYGLYQFLLPTLLIRDPALLKQITVKEFDSFTDHRKFADPGSNDLFTKNLFASEGEKWRDLRSTLSPTFTSSKMKMMFSLMDEIAHQFLNHLKDQNEPILELEVKDAFSRYTTDVIASAAFGITVDSLKDKENEFYRMGKDTNFRGIWGLVKAFMFTISPKIAKALGIALVPRHVTSYFTKVINDTLKEREEKNIIRPDVIHLLTEARKGRLKAAEEEETLKVNEGFASTIDAPSMLKSSKKLEITNTDIVANAFIFFVAGFDTSSTFLTFMFYELAVNPDVQNKLRKEIRETWNQISQSKITYETLLGMKYLDMVVSENLRKWPPAAFTDRRATKAYTIQAEKPGEKPLPLEVGSICWIPIYGIHNDERYFPNPSKFDPERFSDENKRKIDPFTYMPFGLGPRNCIGSRFALLEGKLILFHTLREFEVVPIKKTKIPVVLDKNDLNLRAEGGMWLGFRRIP